MKYSIFLLGSCLVGFLSSCSRPQESGELSFEMKEKRLINSFVPENVSAIPSIKLACKDYFNYNFGDYIIGGKVDSNGWRQGYWKIVDVKNNLKYQGAYVNDKINGWWEFFSSNKLICCGNYELNRKQGFWRYLHVTSETNKFVNYSNDTLTGVAREFTKDSILVVDGLFNKGLREGYWKFYNKTGAMKEKGYFQDNYKSGWWQSYDTNGKLIEEASYSRDEISGYLKRYSDGILLEEGKEFNGKKRGTWKFYDTKGNCIRIKEYEN